MMRGARHPLWAFSTRLKHTAHTVASPSPSLPIQAACGLHIRSSSSLPAAGAALRFPTTPPPRPAAAPSRRMATMAAPVVKAGRRRYAVGRVKGSKRSIFQARGSEDSHPQEGGAGAAPPSKVQLQRLFLQAAVPMIGFGFMDNVVMITMGDIIDNSLGVTFGLSTLTAAGIGQIFSDVSGVCFGGTVEALVMRMGLPTASLSTEQAGMRASKITATFGAAVGVTIGCLLGMGTLLFRDVEKTEERKHEAVFNKLIESESEVEIGAYVAKLKEELSKAEKALKHSERALVQLTPLVSTEKQAMATSLALNKIQHFKSSKGQSVEAGGKPAGGEDPDTGIAIEALKKRVSTVLPPHVMAAIEEREKLRARLAAEKKTKNE